MATTLLKSPIAKLEPTGSKALAAGEGLRLQSGPGRDLIFKVTGENRGTFDYFTVEVAQRRPAAPRPSQAGRDDPRS